MDKLFGVGIYTVPEAARLANIPSQRIRRWLKGYNFNSQGTERSSPPLWKHDIPTIEDSLALSFKDLMELLFINNFRVHGVSWKEIRGAATKAARIFNYTHPFSTKKFMTDGKRIFIEYVEQSGSKALLELVKGQYAIKNILGKHLYAGFEYSSTHKGISRWFPLRNSKSVVVDPRIQFGRPIAHPGGVPTEVLYRAFLAEKSINKVAKWYEIESKVVKAAINFEEKLVA